jgi:RNA polymerase sigma-70 factor (ECF subfamily)
MSMLESEEDFVEAYESYGQRIFRFLFWRTQDTALSEDLTSSVFEKAWRSRSNFKGGSVQAWLYRIARNTLTDHWRKKKELALDDESEIVDESSDDLAAALDTELEIERLEQALLTLPAATRKLVELRFIEGLSAKAVAQQLNISEGNVRIIQYRALKQIRKQLS